MFFTACNNQPSGQYYTDGMSYSHARKRIQECGELMGLDTLPVLLQDMDQRILYNVLPETNPVREDERQTKE